jgi:hypothetical protein
MAAIKADPSEMDVNYQNGSGKHDILSWHPSFALIAPCLMSGSFCLRFVTLSRAWHMPKLSSHWPHNGVLLRTSTFLRPKPRWRDEPSLVEATSVGDSMIVPHVHYGAPACRPLAAMHERQVRTRMSTSLDSCAVVETTYTWQCYCPLTSKLHIITPIVISQFVFSFYLLSHFT